MTNPIMFRPTALPIDPFGTPDTGYKTMRVTSPYGFRDDQVANREEEFHAALDIGNARLGDKVVAAKNGTVIVSTDQPAIPWSYPTPTDMRAEWGPAYGGNVIVIAHAGGIDTQYAHLGERLVARGDHVVAGEVIGAVGETGAAKGRGHLHFGVRDRSKMGNGHQGFVNPWPLIDPTTPWEDPAVIEELREENKRLTARNVALMNRRDGLLTLIDAMEKEQATLEAEAAKVPALLTIVKRQRAALANLRQQLAAE